MLVGGQDRFGDLGRGGVGQAAAVDVADVSAGPWAQVRSIRWLDTPFEQEVVGLEIPVGPAGGVQLGEPGRGVGGQGEHALAPGGSVVTTVRRFQGVPQRKQQPGPNRTTPPVAASWFLGVAWFDTAFFNERCDHGFSPQAARTAALRRLVLQAPAPVIARPLGLHDTTTARIAAEAGKAWIHYASR
ncbi:hypothetical protein ACQP1W_32925 [Spirillospora sp. CA-255316]